MHFYGRARLWILIACLLGAVFGMGVTKAGVLAWGRDDQGQLALNRSLYVTKPVIINDSGVLATKQVTRVVDGYDHALALTSDGLLFAWGDNSRGQLGNGSTRPENRPVPVAMDAFENKKVVGVAAGWQFSAAWTEDGAVFVWGWSDDGECGVFTPNVLSPRLVNTGALAGKVVTKVSAGTRFLLALTSTSELVGWGYNRSGQLGNGMTIDTEVPVSISTGTVLEGLEITEFTAGNFHSLAVSADGRVFSWGYGALGRTGNALIPGLVDMSGALAGKKVSKVTAGYEHSVALTEDNLLYAWGNNYYYTYLGDPTFTADWSGVPRALRMEEFGVRKIVQIAAGVNHSMALADDGTLYVWGYGDVGQFGNGHRSSARTPIESLPSGGRVGRTISRLCEDLNERTTHVLTTDGKLLGWSSDRQGQVGHGSPAWRSEPAELMPEIYDEPTRLQASSKGPFVEFRHTYSLFPTSMHSARPPYRLTGGTQTKQAEAGIDHLVYIDSTNTLKSYGSNTYGQLGGGTDNTSDSAATVVTSGVLAAKSFFQLCAGAHFSLVLTTDGGLYSWGKNDRGQLGIGIAPNSNQPVAVNASTALAGKSPATLAAGDDHVLCVTSDGGLYAWGANDRGQLGIGTSMDHPTPVEIPRAGELAGVIFTKVWAGVTHSFALTSDDRLFGWGSNDHGQLGIGTSSSSVLSPTLVSTGDSMLGKTVQKIAAGRDFTLILCTDGSLFGMGDNRYGSLGMGDRENRDIPTTLLRGQLYSGRTIMDIAVTKSGYGAFALTRANSPSFAFLSVTRPPPQNNQYIESFFDGRHQLGFNDADATVHYLRISSLSSSPLNLSNATFTGPDASRFSLSSPLPATLAPGSDFSFSVSATEVTSTSPARTATLRIETNDPACPVYELPVTLRKRQPRIALPVEYTTSINVNLGSPIELSAELSDPADLYAWYFTSQSSSTGSEILASYRPSLKIAAATMNHSGTYQLQVYPGSPNDYYDNRYFVVTVLPTPVITTQPESLSVATGGTATFSVTATSTSGSLRYQWFHAGEPISGATQATLIREMVRPASAGEYEVRIANDAGTISSQKAILTVTMGLPGYTDSFTDIAFAGEPVVLASGAYGAAPLTIQWSKSGKVIKGATGATYSPAAKMSAAAMGSYSFTMANALSPTPQPGITGWLGMMTRAPATASVVSGKALSLTCTASSPTGTSLSYEWRKDGSSLGGVASVSGRGTKTLKISPVNAATHAGAYVCHVTLITPQGAVTRPHGSTAMTVIEIPSLAPASTELPTVRVGQVISHQLVGIKNPVAYTATGLPPGIILNRSTGLLTGRPTAARFIKGENVPYKVRLTVTNTAGSITQEIEWLVLPPQELTVGQFYGLVGRSFATNAAPSSETKLGGFLSLVLANASSSAVLTLGGTKYLFAAPWSLTTLDAAPRMSHTIVRRVPLASLILQLTINPTTGQINGTLNAGSEEMAVKAERLTPNEALTGWWNAEMSAIKPAPSGTPLGASIGSFKLAANGLAQWTGKMADGVGVTAASGIGSTGNLPLYVSLYSGKGSFQWGAKLRLDGSCYGDGYWSKPAGAGGANYLEGIPFHQIFLSGEKYERPMRGNLLGYAETANNALIQLSGGVPTLVSQTFTLLPSQTASVSANVNSMTLTLTPATGWFTGTFKSTDSPARSGTLHGLVFTRSRTGIGFFRQALPPSVDPKKPVKSGLVEIMNNP
ncbi:MAG: putative Ig domain-containing protein [Verrucomicrobiota bacterium]